MNKAIFFIIVSVLAGCHSASTTFLLPEPVTNHASVLLQKGEKKIIYTFYGLDSSKKQTGIHNKVFKINLETGESSQIGAVPDSLGRLASSASVIKNKAYITGGYAVFTDGKEKSSDQLFIFDPETETFKKGASLLVTIDDHVQSVWKERLLYVISGWNDSVNVRTVQVYDPQKDQWQLASSLPAEKEAAVFGGAGIIVGDTIYFLGGAMFGKYYPPSRKFYKGFIHPEDPLKIDWINAGEFPGPFRYRSAAFLKSEKVYFWGGSNETYNYNGISYSNKQAVEPNINFLVYDIRTGIFKINSGTGLVMDIRNLVHTPSNEIYVVGGMLSEQKVSNKISLINRK